MILDYNEKELIIYAYDDKQIGYITGLHRGIGNREKWELPAAGDRRLFENDARE